MGAVTKAQSREVVAEPADAGASLLAVIERAATNPEVDIDKMERLLAMHERIMQKKAEAAFYAAMKATQAEMPQIVRDAENTHTHSKYARLETIVRLVTPVFTKHGFSLSFGTAPPSRERFVKITCHVAHEDGFSRDYEAEVALDDSGAQGKANKTQTQAFGSTVSYGRRYLTLLIFNITLKNEDNDGNSDNVTEEQAANIEALLTEVGADRAKFLAYIGADSVADIQAKKYSNAIRALEKKRSQ